MNTKFRNKILPIIILLVLTLYGIPSVIADMSKTESPLIINASLEPTKVILGDTMLITAEVFDDYGIESVTADMGGIETIILNLIKGSANKGTWQAYWKVHSTEQKEYMTTITATNIKGKSSSINIIWADPTWWNASWSDRKLITVSNSGSALTDYQVLVTLNTASLIAAGKMQSNGNDIRFIDSDDTTLLDYWIESGINTISTKLWVEVPSIPVGDKTIYVYYGNPSAPAASNGTATFPLFDDFDDGSIDTLKWTITGSPTETGGILTAGGSNYIKGQNTYLRYAVRTRANISGSGTGGDPGLGFAKGFDFFNDHTYIWIYPSQLSLRNVNAGSGQYVTFGTGDLGAYHIWDLLWTSTWTQVLVDGVSRASTGNAVPDEASPPIVAISGGYSVDADWFLVRKYVSPEPTTKVEEEPAGDFFLLFE